MTRARFLQSEATMGKATLALGVLSLFAAAMLCRWETTAIPVGYLIRTDRWTGAVWVAPAGRPVWKTVEEPSMEVPWDSFQAPPGTNQ